MNFILPYALFHAFAESAFPIIGLSPRRNHGIPTHSLPCHA